MSAVPVLYKLPTVTASASGNTNLWIKLDSVQRIYSKKPVTQKAALKTSFNYDSDRGYSDKQSGTITYTFTSK